MWFAAHVILLARFKDGNQDSFPVWENIILIEAESADEAWEKAERNGAESASVGEFSFDDRPAYWEFAGVRKLLQIGTMDPQERMPGGHEENGIEATYSAFTLKNEEDVRKLVDNQAVELIYERVLGGDNEAEK